MFDQMIAEHDAIRAVVGGLRAFLHSSTPIGHCFAMARWSLTRQLLPHIAVEERLFHAHAVGPETPDGFLQRYRDHVTQWTSTRIDEEWATYCHELGAILDTLIHRMDFEEREIYPALREARLPRAAA